MKIAILTNNDRTWSLPVWDRTLNLLKKSGQEVAALFVFPESLGKRKGLGIPMWYLNRFGLWPVLLMALLGLRARWGNFKRGVTGWRALSRNHSIPLFWHRSVNEAQVAQWVKDNGIDVLYISVNEILKPLLIQAPKIGIINKHSALLPDFRGVFPFFWGLIYGRPAGVTFHLVDQGIDTGRSLCQWKHPNKPEKISMMRFYLDVFSVFPDMAATALRRLLQNSFLPASAPREDSYFGFPARDDVRRFKAQGGRIAELSDLFYRPAVRFEDEGA